MGELAEAIDVVLEPLLADKVIVDVFEAAKYLERRVHVTSVAKVIESACLC